MKEINRNPQLLDLSSEGKQSHSDDDYESFKIAKVNNDKSSEKYKYSDLDQVECRNDRKGVILSKSDAGNTDFVNQLSSKSNDSNINKL